MESGNNKVLAIYEDKLMKRISLPLFNEMPRISIHKEKKRTFKYVLNKIRLKKCASATISKPLPTYHVAYLGNVVTGWAKDKAQANSSKLQGKLNTPGQSQFVDKAQANSSKLQGKLNTPGQSQCVDINDNDSTLDNTNTCLPNTQLNDAGDGCIEKPLATLWRNYIQSSRPDVNMNLNVSGGGLKAVTKNHGLTEYWAHRLTTCSAPEEFPRIFCWVYRHEGRRLKHELRCHAALCSSSEVAAQIEKELKEFLTQALTDFKKDKLSRQNARLSLVNSVQENPSLPRRKILLATGSHNYRPPLECSKSAPKLSSIEEIFGEEEDDGDLFNSSQQIYRNILKSYEKANYLFEQSKHPYKKRQFNKWSKQDSKPCDKKCAKIEAFNLCPPSNLGFKNLDTQSVKNETDDEKCDKPLLYTNSDTLQRDRKVSFQPTIETVKTSVKPTLEDNKDKTVDSVKKVDLDFKIGGEVLPAIKGLDKMPNIEHTFITPLLSKGFMEQEQVSLVPVGETHADFSSLKVYKKRSFCEANKDFTACSMFLSGESINQLENIFQAHCSFNGDRSEEEISNKINSTLIVSNN